MAKIIFESEDGKQEVLREGFYVKGDVLFRPDYIATKLWCNDDVASVLEEHNIEPSKFNIEAVKNTGLLKGLEECSDGDWEIIKDAVVACKDDSLLDPKPIVVNELCGLHEHIVKMCIDGDYCERSFIVDGDDDSEDARKDLSAALENTLHRLIDNGATEDDIRRELGAVQYTDDMDDNYIIHIDLGYVLPGPILSVN